MIESGSIQRATMVYHSPCDLLSPLESSQAICCQAICCEAFVVIDLGVCDTVLILNIIGPTCVSVSDIIYTTSRGVKTFEKRRPPTQCHFFCFFNVFLMFFSVNV